MFIPTSPNQQHCNDAHFSACPVCGKQIPWKPYAYCCSKACSAKLRRATNIKKYGVEIAQQSEAVKSKARTTMRMRYGAEHPSQVAEIKSKQVQSFKSHFSKECNPEKYAEMQKKKRDTCLSKYGVEYSFYTRRKPNSVDSTSD